MSESKPESCEACYFETSALTAYRLNGMPGTADPERRKWLCDLCASTETGRIIEYPRQFEGQAATMRTICYVGNVILEVLKKR